MWRKQFQGWTPPAFDVPARPSRNQRQRNHHEWTPMNANLRIDYFRVYSCPFAACRAKGLAKADSFPYTELAENPAKQIFGVVTPDHIANRVKGAAELD